MQKAMEDKNYLYTVLSFVGHDYIFSNDFKPEAGEINGIKYAKGIFPKSGVKFVDYGRYRVVEQNDKTTSKWASLSKAGTKISWLIEKETNRWLARNVNGKVELLI